MSGGAVIIIIDPQVQKKTTEDRNITPQTPQPYDAIRRAIDEAEAAGQRVRIIVTG